MKITWEMSTGISLQAISPARAPSATEWPSLRKHGLVEPLATIVVGEGEYGTRFVTAISKANIHATRFHPEKSRPDGLTIFGNFLERA